MCGAQDVNDTASAAPGKPLEVPVDSPPSSASSSRGSSHKDGSSCQLSAVLQEGRRKEAPIVMATVPLMCQAGTMTEDVFVGQLPSATAPARLEVGGSDDIENGSRQFQGSKSMNLPALPPLTLPRVRSYRRVRILTPGTFTGWFRHSGFAGSEMRPVSKRATG